MQELILFDGGIATYLMEKGAVRGEVVDELNISNPEIVESLHIEYMRAGAEVITSNTFMAAHLERLDLLRAGAEIAVLAADKFSRYTYSCGCSVKAAVSIGPCFKENSNRVKGSEIIEEKYFRAIETVQDIAADYLLFETLPDTFTAESALRAVEICNSSIPVIFSFCLNDRNELISGQEIDEVSSFAGRLEESTVAAAAIGFNCSFGPQSILGAVKMLNERTKIPIFAAPNSGIGEKLLSPGEFADEINVLAECGATMVGGCCGSTPEYIQLLANKFSKGYNSQK